MKFSTSIYKLLSVLFLSCLTSSALVDVSKTLVWGPGLSPDFSFPARYFFIQLVDSNGDNLTESLGEDNFDISVTSPSTQRIRVYKQLLDMRDGSYMMRYRLWQTYDTLKISILYQDKHVGKSPYILEGLIYHEKCYCPEPDIQKWLTSMKCPASYRQIKQDLSIFNNLDLEDIANQTIARYNKRGMHSLSHYRIIDNKIYRKTYGQHVGFKMFSDSILLSLTRKVWLPNMEFFVNLGDWPLENRKISDGPLPIFSWCGSDDSRDIVMPTYDLTESTMEMMSRYETFNQLITSQTHIQPTYTGQLAPDMKVRLPDMEFFVNLGDWPLEKRKVEEGPMPLFSWCGSDDTQDIVMPTYDITKASVRMMDGVSLDVISTLSKSLPASWKDKTDLAFWRGRDSRQERLDLVVMSQKHPEIIDAALTHMFFFPKDDKKYGELVKSISFFDFFKHKYQINIDGTVAAYRFPYLIAGNSLVFKQDSHYYEHFYKDLKPYEHYIPFKRDLSDLMEKIQWAKDNDAKVQEIIKNARNFVRERLMPKDIYCYHVKLFDEYSKRLKSGPLPPDDSWELVKHPDDYDSKCECRKNKVQDKHDEL